MVSPNITEVRRHGGLDPRTRPAAAPVVSPVPRAAILAATMTGLRQFHDREAFAPQVVRS